MKYTVRLQHRVFQVEITGAPPAYELAIDGERFQVDAANLGDDSLLTMLLNGESVLAHTRHVDSRRDQFDVSIGGKYLRLEVLDELTSATYKSQEEKARGRFVLEAPMPGQIVAVRVQVGDHVHAGTPLVVMEAMKMQNELASEVAGVVREVRARVDQAVDSGYELLVIEAD